PAPCVSQRAGRCALGRRRRARPLARRSRPATGGRRSMTSLAPAASRLTGRLLQRDALSDALKRAMFALLGRHFDGVDRPTFEADLGDKNWVIALEDEEGVLRGFSTLLVYRTAATGAPATVVYSGDTIVERAWWGSATLPRTWIHAVRRVAPTNGTGNRYWLLLTSGFRTYRFLPIFFRTFHPRCDGDAAAPGALDAIATERFGPCYDARAGVVRFPRPQVLAPNLLEVPPGR